MVLKLKVAYLYFEYSFVCRSIKRMFQQQVWENTLNHNINAPHWCPAADTTRVYLEMRAGFPNRNEYMWTRGKIEKFPSNCCISTRGEEFQYHYVHLARHCLTFSRTAIRHIKSKGEHSSNIVFQDLPPNSWNLASF